MASQPTFSLLFFGRNGEPVASPGEWQEGTVEVVLPDGLDWHHVHLTIRGLRQPPALQFVDGKERLRCPWPRSPVGRHRIAIDYDGEEQTFDVSIRPRNISEKAFETLLEDLSTRLTGGVAISLQKHGAFAGVKFLPPDACTLSQEQIRLRRALRGDGGRMGLLRVLDVLSARHHQTPAVEEVWKAIDRAGRVLPQRLGSALHRPGNLAQDSSLRNVPERHGLQTSDVYENRVVKSFCDQVGHRLRLLGTAASAIGNESLSQSVQELAAAYGESARKAFFLQSVGRLSCAPDKVTMVQLKRPPYRSALEGYLEFQRQMAVSLDDWRLEAPLENLPHLYQLWGTLQVINTILDATAGSRWKLKRQRLLYRHAGGAYIKVLADGQPAIVLWDEASKTTLKVIPERTYSHKTSGLGSSSHSQRPDLAVELQREAGPPTVFLFDPKYKMQEAEGDGDAFALKEDIDKMHTYRDAIRWDNREHVVRHAAILFPGSTKNYGPGVSALRSDPSSPDELGANVLRILGSVLT